MKKRIGVPVAVLVTLAVLLWTCDSRPDSSASVRLNESVSSIEFPEPASPGTSPSVPQGTDAASGASSISFPPTVQVTHTRPPSGRTSSSIARPESHERYEEGIALVPLPVASLSATDLEVLLSSSHSPGLEREEASGLDSNRSPDSLRSHLRISLPDRDWNLVDVRRGQPASTINTPTAYGQRWGDVYAGAAYQNRIRYDDWNDGVASVGIGLGDPDRYVGLDVSLNILDTYTDFGEDRSLSVRLHRRLPYRSAVAVGHENLWHTDGTDGGSSRYVVVSKVVLMRDRPTSPFGSMVFNLGLGDDRFLPEQQFARGAEGVNVFGSLGVRVHPRANAVANWTGQDLALGLSVAPVRRWPLVITPAVVDLTGRAGDGARFSVSAGLNYNFRR